MTWAIILILLVLWLAGQSTSNTFGGYIHILLFIAAIIFVIKFAKGRKADL
jgi:hypothetical protein